jgi:hypothetical protein
MLKVHTINLVLSVFGRWIGNQLDQIGLQRVVRDSNKHTVQCLLICYTVVLSTSDILQETVLRSNTRVVQPVMQKKNGYLAHMT